MKKLVLCSLMAVSLAACAETSTPIIKLDPQVTLKTANIGQGKTVSLQVIDARPQNSYSSAKIDPTQNVSQLFNKEFSDGLNKYGFKINNTSKDQLTVQLLAIDYRTLNGIASSNTETFVSAQVMAQNGKGNFTQTYNASAYNDNYLSATKENPSEEVNRAVNKLLTNILNDKMLMQFLAS